jgi:outer membrane lipoprotein-sorting protein
MYRVKLVGLVLLVCAILSVRPTWSADGSGTELLKLLDLAEKHYAQVRDYTSTMVSRERVGEALRPQERILLKFQRPFKVYMRWMEGPSKGREGLYSPAAHDGKFLISEPKGFQRFFTAALEPTDHRVMEQSRHPVTDIGIGRLLEIVGENARRGSRNGVLRVVDRGTAEYAGRRVRQVECVLPQEPHSGYYGYRVLLNFDEENHLPTRVVVYDWTDQLVEDYTYGDLRLNPGLTSQDFDPSNKEYGFSFLRIQVPG